MWIAVLKAADAAARWQVHQPEGGSRRALNHLLEVASIVAEQWRAKTRTRDCGPAARCR
jgi:hypothetical protein